MRNIAQLIFLGGMEKNKSHQQIFFIQYPIKPFFKSFKSLCCRLPFIALSKGLVFTSLHNHFKAMFDTYLALTMSTCFKCSNPPSPFFCKCLVSYSIDVSILLIIQHLIYYEFTVSLLKNVFVIVLIKNTVFIHNEEAFNLQNICLKIMFKIDA